MTANGRLVLLVVCFFLLGVGLTYLRLPPLPPEVNKTVIEPEKSAADNSRNPDTTVQVEIRGRGVNEPGRYRLPADSTVRHLIQQAGGLKPNAVDEGLPRDQPLSDELSITIPSRTDFRKIRSGTATLTKEHLIGFYELKSADQSEQEQRLDLNTASKSQLKGLPGIGEVLAERIVKNRNQEGRFQEASDVKRVLGIGTGRFERIKPFVTAR